jgi:CheY-like chemotaxis protein
MRSNVLETARSTRSKQPPRNSGSKSKRPPRQAERVGILIVDDDPSSAKLASIILRSEGYDVRVAASAEEATRALDAFRPRLIILDLILPLMNGLMFAQQLKADPSTKDIVLIAVTAFNGSAVERMAFEAGCAAYIRKPIDPLTFAEHVGRHLGGSDGGSDR